MKVEKRDGRIVPFDKSKIHRAIEKAFTSCDQDTDDVTGVVDIVMEAVTSEGKETWHIEELQDIVEDSLMTAGHTDVARSYIKYRQRRHQLRQLRVLLGVTDDLKLGINAATLLNRRYLIKDKEGNVTETPSQLFRRVAKAVARVETHYDRRTNGSEIEDLFYHMMTNLEFLPNSPTLFSAGTELGQLSACFVIPIEDSLDSIFQAVWQMAKVQKSGGGTGFAFSRLRPKESPVGTTGGVASGPVSFMRIFDTATDVIKQGGKRRGANMGVLRVDHPDILEFIRCKADKVSYRNFNISIAVTDKFMEAYFADEEYELIDPHNGKPTEKLSARFVFEQIAHYAWLTGDPGILYIDRINQAHPLKGEEIEATNPCGEVPLLGHECCVLGSINLSLFVKEGKMDYRHLGEIVELGVRFLDNIIDANKYPFNEIDIKAKAGRKIGLGIMGFAEMLIQLGVAYDSEEGLQWARDIMRFVNERSRKASAKLAKLRGNFELKGQSKIRAKYRRNATVNTIAPTGSIGIIAGTSSGIEPLFGISYVRVLAEGVQLHETNKYFEQIAKEQGFWDEALAKEIAKTGSVQDIDSIPVKMKALFKTAHEISPEQHVRMQAAFQEHVDNAVSKTCNLSNSATPEDIRSIYLLAWELGCKGITVFRDGCLDVQVLYKGDTLTCELDDPSCPSCSG